MRKNSTGMNRFLLLKQCNLNAAWFREFSKEKGFLTRETARIPYCLNFIFLLGYTSKGDMFMVSNFCPHREQLRNVFMLLPLLFLAGIVSACSTSIISGSSPTPTSTQGIRGIFHEYALPPSQFVPGTITAGPDGNLWFTEIMQNGSVQMGKIERITPTGTFSEFSLPSANTLLSSITTGPDGNLWFTEQQGKIGRMTLTGKVSEFSLPFHQYPAGPDPTKEPAGSAQGEPLSITAGSDGNLWFTEIGTNNGPSEIGVISPQGKIREFTLSHYILGSITRGSDGNLWFTEFQYDKTGATAGKIGSITTAGKISYFPLPTSSNSPTSITFGTDHTLWFIEVEITPTDPSGKNGKIGHLV